MSARRSIRTVGVTRRSALRGAVATSLAGLFVAAGCRGRSGGRAVSGGFADEGMAAGHALRDGRLGGGRGGSGAQPTRERRCRVLVVGGGVAGLGAAWRLRRAGVDGVAVVELGNALGGTSRAGSMPGASGALACPFGAHYLPLPRADQRAVAAFLTDAGIATGVEASGRLAVPDRALVRDPAERIAGLGFFEEGLWLEAGANSEDHAQLDRFEGLVESSIDVDAGGRRLFGLPIASSSDRLRDLDRRSAADWAAEHGLDSPRVRWYLEYATRDDLGASLADTSAWALLHYFAARADLRTKESAPYLTWPEGNARLVQHLRELGADEVESGQAVVHVDPEAGSALAVHLRTGALTRWTADRVVLATPQFLNRRLLSQDPASEARAKLRYSPWVTANLYLERLPDNRGFPFAWDSVVHGSPSLGYVDACHQLDRAGEQDTVWTWYLPIIDSDERAAREQLLARPWEAWRDAILADLRAVHPNIDDVVRRIDVWRWGHAMVKPTPGTLFGGGLRAAARPVGKVHLAHSDLSGIALFEEAHWQGTRAAEEILAAMGEPVDSLLA